VLKCAIFRRSTSAILSTGPPQGSFAPSAVLSPAGSAVSLPASWRPSPLYQPLGRIRELCLPRRDYPLVGLAVWPHGRRHHDVAAGGLHVKARCYPDAGPDVVLRVPKSCLPSASATAPRSLQSVRRPSWSGPRPRGSIRFDLAGDASEVVRRCTATVGATSPNSHIGDARP
jgi:hypothetical protein